MSGGLRRRLQALEQQAGPANGEPLTEIWLPHKAGDGQKPGHYPLPGGQAVLVIYEPERGEADAGAGDGASQPSESGDE
jgi:hypothetical protein